MKPKEWRPKNWDEEIMKLLEASTIPEHFKQIWRLGIETGADAILKAEREKRSKQ